MYVELPRPLQGRLNHYGRVQKGPMTKRRILVTVAMIGASAVLTLACGSVVVGTSSDYRIATAARDPQLLTILDGTLSAQINSDGTACLWITAQETRDAGIRPEGIAARRRPIL